MTCGQLPSRESCIASLCSFHPTQCESSQLGHDGVACRQLTRRYKVQGAYRHVIIPTAFRPSLTQPAPACTDFSDRDLDDGALGLNMLLTLMGIIPGE
jgi:hypothetical protein